MSDLRRTQLAHEGMRMLLCSEVKEAEDLFRTSRNLGAELNAGYSFVQLVRAVMSFDEDAMDNAYKSLEATENFCDFGSKKFNLFSNSSSSRSDQLSPHEKLRRRSIIADCIFFEAILVFLKQGLASYMKGGYLLRKAYKLYEKIFKETEELCKQASPISHVGATSTIDKHVGSSIYDKEQVKVFNEEENPGIDEASLNEIGNNLSSFHIGLAAAGGFNVDLSDGEFMPPPPSSSSSSESNMVTNGGPGEAGPGPGEAGPGDSDNAEAVKVDDTDFSWGTPRSSKRGGKKNSQRPLSGYLAPEVPSTPIHNLDHEDARLRGAVYFGYGLMNIILSLIPPKLMKLANLFGIHGNRRLGLEALEYASNSQDMKAPLSRIALLWYHTIIRPFFALDGEEEDAGAEAATALLDTIQEMYPHSALFLYFRGKVCYLRCNLTEALVVYTEAAQLAKDQREIEHIVLYEKGWIHFLKLDYKEALDCYIRLKNETRWSACYYAYLSAILSGVSGDLIQAREYFLQSTRLVKRKNNNLEKFCARRGSHYKLGQSPMMSLEMVLMAIEVIYLWRALPFCSMKVKQEMLDKLSSPLPTEAQPVHQAMRAWLRGGVLNSMSKPIEAEKSLMEALRFEGAIRNDKHILSFSLYELGMIQVNRNEFARARNTLNRAKEEYSGYEFEARLNFKVHSAMGLCQ